MSVEEVLAHQEGVKKVKVSEKVLDYLLDIVEATRRSPYLTVGVSTRGALSLLSAAKAKAYLHGRDYVLPEDLKELCPYVLLHRLIFREEYVEEKSQILEEILRAIPVPVY